MAFLIHRQALETFFTCDDLVALAGAAGLEPTSGAFRPLSAVLAARLQYLAFGLAPAGYHVVNLLLHLLATAGVYALATTLGLGVRTATAAAALFACSGIAFTPLHAASGIGDLLAANLLALGTLLYLMGHRDRRPMTLWLGAAVASLAFLAKENAVAWPLLALALGWRGRAGSRGTSWAVAPVVCGAIAGVYLLALARTPASPPSGAYGLDVSLTHIAVNLATYLSWSVSAGVPIRDLVAAADPSSWAVAIPAGLLIVMAVWWTRAARDPAIVTGLLWWLAFLLPALPLAHHTYLYYLYVPWVGGAIALAAGGAVIGSAVRSRMAGAHERRAALLAPWVAAAVVGAWCVAEGRAIAERERATIDSLPADRTLREASLLANALGGLRAQALPPGTAVGFVNPVPRAAGRLPSRSGDRDTTRYVPLEIALCNGRALRLFVPGVADSGFAATIPPGWERVECFLYEQRGWLRRWGAGQEALMRQAELQASSGRWAEAESSFARVRALGDTVPEAVLGQAVALRRSGRAEQAAALADSFIARWPGDERGALLRSSGVAEPVDERLMRPFDPSLPARAD